MAVNIPANAVFNPSTPNSMRPNWKERQQLERIPNINRELPFSRFNTKHLSYETMLTMNRNRITMKMIDPHHRWLAENCTDIYTVNDISDKMEVMFLSPEDMALFVLKFT